MGQIIINPKTSIPIIQVRMTDTSYNFSNNTPTTLPIVGSVDINTNTNVFAAAVGTHSITILEEGIYEMTGHYGMAKQSGGAVRNNIRFFISKNSTPISPVFQNNYFRDSSGHEEVSQELQHIEECVAGDVIIIRNYRISGGNTGVVIIDGLCYFNIKKLSNN